jgi:hypothetical protein
MYELAYSSTARIIRIDARECTALTFVRDVVLFGRRNDAAQFRLRKMRAGKAQVVTVAEGNQLVARALEDHIL